MGRKPVFALATALMTSVALAGCQNNSSGRAPTSQPFQGQVAKGPTTNSQPTGNGTFTGQVGGGTTINGPNGPSNFGGNVGGTYNTGNPMPQGQPTLGANNQQNRNGVAQTGFTTPGNPSPMMPMPGQSPQPLPQGFSQPPSLPNVSGASYQNLTPASSQGKSLGSPGMLPPPAPTAFGTGPSGMTSQQTAYPYDAPSMPQAPTSVPVQQLPGVQPTLNR
ncbi:MAG TPA: hypothetical protein VE988_15560 [Gemmataceae bacterium]|nr:hypothetical protein [Gemmataceae bacterium]